MSRKDALIDGREPVRKPKSDGFDEMINADHPGAKEKDEDVLAEIIRAYRPDKNNDIALADEILAYLRGGETLV